MNRRDILKLGLLCSLPGLTSFAADNTDNEILTGIKKPVLTGTGYLLLPNVAKDFAAMQKEAAKSGIRMNPVSSYRSFERQAAIWNRKYNSYTASGLSPAAAINKIIEYSTLPGTSRHHWGTDFDIIDAAQTYSGEPLNADKFQKTGPFHKMYEWMNKNAGTYGFSEVYTNDKERTGFKYEPWHYTHAPTSIPLLKDFLKINLIETIRAASIQGKQHISQEFISGYTQSHILGIATHLIPVGK